MNKIENNQSNKITHARLLELIRYDPNTGIFVRKSTGNITGFWYRNYWRLYLDRRHYFGQIIAWFYMTGKWPEKQIDHINGISYDNSWLNLREATNSQNCANRKTSAPNKHGFRGIYKNRNSWVARIRNGGKALYLGCFSSPEEAHAAYARAAESIFGKFARIN